MREQYDVIIIGARCAGAPLATHLARAGASVALLDAARLPSDQVLSTHMIHPCGMDLLDELDVGDAVRQRCAPTHVVRQRMGSAHADLPFAEGRVAYCPRRERLDALLLEAAVAAGADVQDRTRVTEVIEEDGRVTGVRAEHEGRTMALRARVTVGADGRYSDIARLVGADEYVSYDAPRAAYWAYWDAPPIWHDKTQYPFDMFLTRRDRSLRIIFQTDDDQLLLGSVPPLDVAAEWRRGDHRAKYIQDLTSDPVFAPLIEGNEPDGKVRGVVQQHFFFRQSAGSGWALIGDAGHHKDFVTGYGISDALSQAKSLAAAIVDGTDEALVRYWRERDVESLELFRFGEDLGDAGDLQPLQEIVCSRLTNAPELWTRFTGVFDRAVSPYNALPMPFLLGSVAKGLLQGRFGVLPEMVRRVRRGMSVQRELAERQRLLEAASETAPIAGTRTGVVAEGAATSTRA